MALNPLIATLKLHLTAGFTDPASVTAPPVRRVRPQPAQPSGVRFRQHCSPGSDPVPPWLHRVWGWF